MPVYKESRPSKPIPADREELEHKPRYKQK